MYCFTTSISHGVEKYFPRLWGTGISDAIFDTQDDVLIDLVLCICLFVDNLFKLKLFVFRRAGRNQMNCTQNSAS